MVLNLLSILLSATLIAPANAVVSSIEKAELFSPADKVDYVTRRPEGTLKFIKAARGDYSLIIKKHEPVSVRTIDRRISEMGGDKSTLMSQSINAKETVFGFSNKAGQLHFFSTRGGYLLVTPKKGDSTQSVAAWLTRFKR